MPHRIVNFLFRLLLCMLLFSIPFKGMAQGTLSDAIKEQLDILNDCPNDKDALRQISMYYLNQAKFDEAIEYANRLMEIGEKEEDEHGALLYAHIFLGQALMMKGGDGIYDAYKYLKRAEKTAESNRLDSALCSVYNGLGLFAVNIQKDNSGALQYFFKGIESAKRSQYKRLHGILLCNVAGIYSLLNDDSGLPYTEECYQLGHQEQDPYLSYMGSLRTAYMLHLKEEYSLALKYAREAEFLIQQNGFSDYADVYALHGYILDKLNETEEAEEYFLKALEDRTQNNISSALNAYLGYADILLRRGEMERAIRLLQEGVEYSQAYPSAVFRSDLILKLSECYEKNGNIDKALSNYKDYKNETDSLYRLEKERIAHEMRVKYDMERAEDEIKEQQLIIQEREKRMYLMFSLLLVIAVVLVVVWVLYYKQRGLYKAIVRQNQEAIRREHTLKERIEAMEAKDSSVAEGSSQTKYASSSLNEEKKSDLFQVLEKLMSEQKVYMDNLLTKDKVAELLGSNRTYLSQIINEQTGKTFTQYINDYRIQDAIRRLSDPENQIPLKALSVELGFNSSTTFYKQFQTATGMTPAQYRSQVIEMHKC